MGGVGPAPAATRKSKKKLSPMQLVKAPDVAMGPELPDGWLTDRHGNAIEWHPATKAWWDNWRTSPQATRMLTGPDWDFLLDTALMHHSMWNYKKWELASEVRLRVAKFGATPDDRARLRMEVHTNQDAAIGVESQSNNVTDIRSRRARLSDG